MKLFISWSDAQSRQVANALHGWLPNIIQSVTPFMSDHIPKGAQGLKEIADNLDTAKFGILCITPSNQHAPWLNFEAGALVAKFADQRRVAPYMLDMTPAELEQPLGMLQGAEATRSGTLDLVRSINTADDTPLVPEVTLFKAFEAFWHELEEKLNDARTTPASLPTERRGMQDMIEEILGIVRSQQRTVTWGSTSFGTGLYGVPVIDDLTTRSPPPSLDAQATGLRDILVDRLGDGVVGGVSTDLPDLIRLEMHESLSEEDKTFLAETAKLNSLRIAVTEPGGRTTTFN